MPCKCGFLSSTDLIYPKQKQRQRVRWRQCKLESKVECAPFKIYSRQVVILNLPPHCFSQHPKCNNHLYVRKCPFSFFSFESSHPLSPYLSTLSSVCAPHSSSTSSTPLAALATPFLHLITDDVNLHICCTNRNIQVAILHPTTKLFMSRSSHRPGHLDLDRLGRCTPRH